MTKPLVWKKQGDTWVAGPFEIFMEHSSRQPFVLYCMDSPVLAHEFDTPGEAKAAAQRIVDAIDANREGK